MSSVSPAAASLTAQLLCRLRPGVTDRFTVKGKDVILGRDPGSGGIRIRMESVSRRHARVTYDGKNYWIQGLSPAGTHVNGRLVLKERLRNLDVVTLGKSVDLLFVLAEQQPGLVKKQGIVRAALVLEGGESFEIALGEITIGRATSNNLVLEGGAVSKVHASIERTAEKLVLRDQGSANGTCVNGRKVTIAELRSGDVISLGAAAELRVVVDSGEVTTSSTPALAEAIPEPALRAPEDAPAFSQNWKTRYDWDTSELQEIAALRAQLVELQKAGPGDATGKLKKAGEAAIQASDHTILPKRAAHPGAATGAPAPPDAAPKPPAVAASPAEARPAEAAPKPPERPAAAAAAPASPAAAAPRPPAAARSGQPAAPPQPSPAAVPPAPPRPAAAPAAAAPQPQPAPTAPIAEVRLTSDTVTLTVDKPGSYELGRSADVPLVIAHPTVSRRHARVVLSADRERVTIEHIGGLNSTLLNGKQLAEPKTLSDGDELAIAAVSLRVAIRRSGAS
jgi:pSer/pThr/pTyr-binding forkhead associated (FHA) protein